MKKEDKLKAEASKFPNIIDFLNKPPEDLQEMQFSPSSESKGKEDPNISYK